MEAGSQFLRSEPSPSRYGYWYLQHTKRNDRIEREKTRTSKTRYECEDHYTRKLNMLVKRGWEHQYHLGRWEPHNLVLRALDCTQIVRALRPYSERGWPLMLVTGLTVCLY